MKQEATIEQPIINKQHQEKEAENAPTGSTVEQETTVSQEAVETSEQLTIANEKYIRLYSEFENYKKRTVKEKKITLETANSKILKELLPVVDDFERGIELFQQEDTDTDKAIQDGVKLIHEKLMHVLNQASVQSMKVDKGASFNEEFHDAIVQMPVDKEAMKGKIVDVVEKGYLLNGHVLRFAKVVIGS